MLGKRAEAEQLTETVYLSLESGLSVIHQLAFPSSENYKPAEAEPTQCEVESSAAAFSEHTFEHDLLGITSRRVKLSLPQIKCVFVQLAQKMLQMLPSFPEIHGRPDLK